MPQPKTLRLILGDQLNESHSWFKTPDKHVTYLLMEMRQETDYVTHHIQKVAAFFAAMRKFADHLQEHGHRVTYFRLDDRNNRQTIEGNLTYLIEREKFNQFEYMMPDEYRLDRQLRHLSKMLPLASNAVDTDHFLSKRLELKDFFSGKKRYLMESFYRWMRKRYDVLMVNGKPAGGKWNFDQNNRNAYDPLIKIPRPYFPKNDVSGIFNTIQKEKVQTIGSIQPDSLIWPLNRAQSLNILKDFTDHFLPNFGTFQDAMTIHSWHLFHSRLSFALNTKMLHPLEVLQSAIEVWEKSLGNIDISQIEGFVRQILGWREYMRGIYWALMPDLEKMNFFHHKNSLPRFYWSGETRMACLKSAIDQSLIHAYAHHIQRLMITGNFALLAGVHPDEVDSWYLGIYIDAIQWVELPNTRAMSQYADGGKIATKPYVSSAKYIHTMSDYCESCVYKWKQRYGSMACPFNSLYWDFLERHRSRLETNARMKMMYRVWDRMQEAERKEILKQAYAYTNNIENL